MRGAPYQPLCERMEGVDVGVLSIGYPFQDLKAFLLGKRVEYGESYHSGSLTLHLATGILSGLEHMHRHNFLHL